MEVLTRVVAWTGWEIDAPQVGLLAQFEVWLRTEAIAAGGLGPNERDRVWDRHIADSLLFAAGWPPPQAPASLTDLGSGVGLPGIPLAILWPSTEVWLVDRSQRRTDLTHRAVRMLDLENVTPLRAEAAKLTMSTDLVVSRAAADPAVVAGWGRRILKNGGRMVVGGSHHEPPRPGPGEQIVAVPPEILDRPVWLRMMAAS